VSSLTYVYCLVRSTRPPRISRRLTSRGLPGSRNTRALPAGDSLWLIVTSLPASEYDDTAVARGLQDLDWVSRRAMAHEAVVEQFLSARAVLPMQLFTLFTSDERAVHDVDRHRQAILAVAARVERKLEWGLRLTFEEQAAADGVNAMSTREPRSRTNGPRRSEARKTGATGADYLARKRDLLDVRRVQLRGARSAANRLFDELTREAEEARRRTATDQSAPGARLLLDAAFLVASSRTRTFRAAVSRSARAIGAAGVVVSLTGPWPPYNFIAPPAASTRRLAPARRARGPRGKTAR